MSNGKLQLERSKVQFAPVRVEDSLLLANTFISNSREKRRSALNRVGNFVNFAFAAAQKVTRRKSFGVEQNYVLAAFAQFFFSKKVSFQIFHNF